MTSEGGRIVNRKEGETSSAAERAMRKAAEFADEVSTLMEQAKKAASPIHVASITFNLLQTTMGVGILSLAATYSYAGAIGGTILFTVAAFVAYYSMHLLLKALLVLGSGSIEGLGERCFGALGKAWVQSMLIGCTLVAMTCFLVPLKAFLFDTLQQLLTSSQFHDFKHAGGSPELCLGIILALVILPLSLQRRIGKLWISSLFGVFFTMYFVVVSVIYMGRHVHTRSESLHCHELHKNGDADTPTGSVRLFGHNVLEVMQAISIIACSFCCQMTVPPIYREVRCADPDDVAVKKIDRAAWIAMGVACLLYVATAVSGYVIWKDLSPKPTSILACYDPSEPDIILVYLGMSFVLMFAFPLVLFSVRFCVASMVFGDECEARDLTTSRHVCLTLAIITPVATVAMVTSKLTTVIAVGGAFTAPGICYIIPAALYLKAKELARQHQMDEDDDDFDGGGVEEGCGVLLQHQQDVLSESNVGGWFLLVFGIFAQIVCILGAILGIALKQN